MAYSASIKVIKWLKNFLLLWKSIEKKFQDWHAFLGSWCFPLWFIYFHENCFFFVRQLTQRTGYSRHCMTTLISRKKNFSSKHYHLTIIKKTFYFSWNILHVGRKIANHNFSKVCRGNHLLYFSSYFLFFAGQ